jgi:uncharacterized membrane protein
VTEPIEAPVSPTPDERTMAVLANALQLVGWFIAPLVILLIKRESKFVKFHALQALFLQMVYFVLFATVMIAFAVTMLAVGVRSSSQEPPVAMLIFFPIFWLLIMGAWVSMLVLAIVHSVKAGRGEWSEYPLIGPLAARVAGIRTPGSPA